MGGKPNFLIRKVQELLLGTSVLISCMQSVLTFTHHLHLQRTPSRSLPTISHGTPHQPPPTSSSAINCKEKQSTSRYFILKSHHIPASKARHIPCAVDKGSRTSEPIRSPRFWQHEAEDFGVTIAISNRDNKVQK